MASPTDQQPPDMIALIAALLREQLNLPVAPPRVFIYNENWAIPKQTWMFLVVGILAADNFGHGQGYAIRGQQKTLVERQVLEQSVTVTVDAFSVSTEARVRLPEILFALQGDAAERLMESATLRIFRPQPFVDLSQLEASRRLNRFQTQFAVYQGFGRERPVPYMQPKSPYVGKLLVQQ